VHMSGLLVSAYRFLSRNAKTLFYYDRAAYRQEQAVDGWKKVFAFLDKNL